ncbi:MAG TPA: HlyD family efflux transporter periplasmic adaptor subunit, partial [Candidatus Ozemobacteraceae bacterium]|nr:HlyD family efflux transporter periplasmic adaptor subunit [Candidatus Ozemobacteraceae bacterium]
LEIASAVIRTETDGIAIRKKTYSGVGWEKATEGDRVFPGYPFLAVLSSSQLAVELRVDQRDAGNLASGQSLVFQPDSYPEYRLPGKITEIGVLAEEGELRNPEGDRVVKVTGLLDQQPDCMVFGLSGNVEILDSFPATGGILADRGCLERQNGVWRSRAGYQPLPENLVLQRVTDRWVCFVDPSGTQPRFSPPATKLVRKALTRKMQIPGEVKARQRSLLASTFSGRIATVLDDGTSVKKNDVVARLDTTELEKGLADLNIQIKTKSEQLELQKEKASVDLPRFTQKVQNARLNLQVSELEHKMLLERRDENQIINLRKTHDLGESRLNLLRETSSLEEDLMKRGLKSEIEILQNKLEIMRQERDQAVNSYKLRLEEGGPTRRQVRLSLLNLESARLDLELACQELEMASFSARLEEKSLEAELKKMNFEKALKERRIREAVIV